MLLGSFIPEDLYAVPPRERVPLDEITILGMDESMTVKSNQQTLIRVDYQSNFPNTEYVILFQITNEQNQVVMLSWIEGFQLKLTDQPGSFVCGDKICYDEWAHSTRYVCGDELCEGNYYAKKFVETSWLPTEPGKYEIVAFAWESVDNPTALSPPRDINITVT